MTYVICPISVILLLAIPIRGRNDTLSKRCTLHIQQKYFTTFVVSSVCEAEVKTFVPFIFRGF